MAVPTSKGMRYLKAAKDALAYVKKQVPDGPANQPKQLLSLNPDNWIRQLRAMGNLSRTRDKIDQDTESQFVASTDALRSARVWAEAARKKHGGNCGELSALAFEYLRLQGVRPLDWAHFIKHDHAFVIIGRPAGEKENNPPDAWFYDVVICDPWYDRAGFWSGMLADYPTTDTATNVHYNPTPDNLPVWENIK